MFGVLKPRLLRKLEMHTRRHMWPTESEDRCSRSVGHIKNANQLYHRTELFNCPFFKHSQWAESLSRLQNIHTVRWNVTHSTRSLVVSDNACSPHGVLLSKWHNLIDLGILTHQIEQFGLFNKYKRPHFYFFLILTTSISTKFQPEVFALFPYSSDLSFTSLSSALTYSSYEMCV